MNSSPNQKAFVIGVGMTKFLKPGSHDLTYIDLGRQAVVRALIDSNTDYSKVEQAYCGYVFESSCAGQRVLYEVGMTGIPIVNLNNNCATGSTAFNLAYSAVKSGQADCVLALGFDKMKKGPLPMEISSSSHPVFKHSEPLIKQNKFNPKIPPTPQMFGAAGKEHMSVYGTSMEQLCKISVKNYKHGSNNPYAQFRKTYTAKEVENSPMISYPLTKLQCCPTSDGAAAVLIASEKFIKEHRLENQAVEVLASVMRSDKFDTYEKGSPMALVGSNLTKRTALAAYEIAGIKPSSLNVVELHDCFSANELVTYEGLALCEVGTAGSFIDRGDNTYGGKLVVNPSGGLTSKGHPLGATGLAQICELTWQLRGMADKRQVKDAQYALAHNLGLGSAVVVSILKKYNQNYERRENQTSDPDKLEKIENNYKGSLSIGIRPKF